VRRRHDQERQEEEREEGRHCGRRLAELSSGAEGGWSGECGSDELARSGGGIKRP
jgi:hypothetical protein